MDFRIEQIGGIFNEWVNLRITSNLKESNNELENIICEYLKTRFMSYEELMDYIFVEKKNLLIKNIQMETIDNDVVIKVEYFEDYKGNNYHEWTNIFRMEESEFYESKLSDKILHKIAKINEEKEVTDGLINSIKESIKDKNARIKPLSEKVVIEYLTVFKKTISDGLTNISFEELDKYITDNYEYIKSFVKENWKYKKVFEGIFITETLTSILGIIGSLNMLATGNENTSLQIMINTIIFTLISLTATELVESRLVDNTISQIKSDVSKVKIKK